MRKLSLLALSIVVVSACATTRPAPPTTAEDVAGPHGMTATEEATILRLEDRREFDRTVSETFMHHENALHRARMALALGRIGQATFDDANGNGVKDTGERQAGVDLLIAAAGDHDALVRTNVAFSLGEIGDPAAVETLFTLAADPENATVAAEAVEALSKIAASVPLQRYAELTKEGVREGVRARAVQFLFRFASDDASRIAAALLSADDVAIRREATYALSRRKFPEARATLQLLLSDRDMLTRSFAARALGIIGSPESLSAVLLSASNDAHPWVRTNALRAVAQIAEANREAFEKSATIEDAVRVITLATDADPGTRATAIDTLGYYARLYPAARNKLFDAAANGSRWIRELATGAIAKQFADEKESGLEALISTDEPWMRVRALEATSKMRVGPALRARLATAPAAITRATVIDSIPDETVDSEMDLVERGLTDEDVVVRGRAIDKLSKTKKLTPAELAVRLHEQEAKGRTDTLNDARLSAIAALAEIDVPERETFLRGLLTDRDPVARRMAANLIVEKLKAPQPQFTPLAVDRPLAEYEEIVRWSKERHSATLRSARGTIVLALTSQDAPMTAWNFAKLASKGYFDHSSFMRVVPNFVIQGGDPRNDMNGGPGYAIRDEINLQKYTRAAVGMALSGPDTGGSQFFITHSPQPHLDGGYTIFARVVSGMSEVVDQMERGDAVESIRVDANPSGVSSKP